MAYVIIDKTRKVNYGFGEKGNWLKGDVVLPNADDNFAHTYETLQDCIEYIIWEVENKGLFISDFAISEVKEMDKQQMYDMVQSYLQEKDNEQETTD